ncbi:GMC oxidoreductase [Niallia sp. NCCP-28]|uniref:GMC oxidoreductase n=1 Tax=Niallia sp. NCCP-28 TaxID=2934712 RepID=UPI00208BD3D2|nr:GMC oxidoreductase [Niallia sp. NCCP-28]GKU85165.1 pyranose oxidase [Niallia sp. NCCP-28]
MQSHQNEWIPITPLEQMTNKEYDVLIVGSGAGGGAALWRLCEQWKNNDKRIGLLEAGDLMLPTHGQNLSTMNVDRLLNEYFPKVSTHLGRRLPEYPDATLVFALGGRTLFWSAASPRIPVFEMKKWPVTAKEMNFYYNIAEKIMNVTPFFAQGSSMQNTMLERLKKNGFLEAIDLPMAVNLKGIQYGQINSDAFFSSIHFLAYALNWRPFDLAVNSRVVQVVIDKGKAAGVHVISPDKKSCFIRGKTVVLSASALETPRILLYSGIQGPAIGHYLTNHSLLRATGKISRKNFSEEVLGNLVINIPQTKHSPFQIQIFGPEKHYAYQQFEEKPFLEELRIAINTFGKVESRFENSVYLDFSERDEYGIPKIQVNFSYSETDNMIIQQMAQAKVQAALAMKLSLISQGDSPPISLMPPGNDYHESGTCRMGDDPLTSATNRFGQIHGIPGLYVADNSVLPSIGAANPTLTTISLAIRTADYILQQLG